MASFPSVTISKFLGMDVTRDKFSLLQGQYKDGMSCQLMKNENYLYLSTGGIEERGGGARLTTAPTASSKIYALDNFKNNSDEQFLICVQGTKIYYYDSGWNDLGLALTNNKRMRFDSAGAGSNRSLYGVNGNDSVVKITGSVTASFVASSPTSCKFIKLHKNRLFAIDDKDTLYYTDVSAFDTWNTGSNYTYIYPGSYGDLQALEIWGDSLFIFKRDAVFVLPNASDAPSDWVILKTDALIGTSSPDSVRKTRLGIIYFASDNRVRLLSPNITFSSSEYTLGGSGSPAISTCIQEDITEYLDEDSKPTIFGILFKDLYILGFRSVNNSNTYNDQFYFADTSKLMAIPDNDTLQPYWGKFTNFDYDLMATQDINQNFKIYGSKGAVDGSVDGDVYETLNDTIHNDGGSGIEAKAILGWIAPGGPGLYKKIKQVYLFAYTENWYLNITMNAYKLGREYPEEGGGTQRTFITNENQNSVVGTSLVGTATVGYIGISTKKYRVSLKGHYFTAEFSNSNANEFTRVHKIIVYFRPIKNS